jgi:ribosomal protein L17
MRHGKKINHLSRTSAHRKALMKNMSCALIKYKRINTTLAKAKALRRYAEPIITKAKDNTTHSRRTAFRYLQQKAAVKELFGPIRDKVGDRPGGYLRIIKTGFRQGDAAEMAMIEFVDFNDVYNGGTSGGKKEEGKKKRTRRGKKKSSGSTEAKAAAVTAAAVEKKAEKASNEEE